MGRITISDIAEKAGVSISAVSYALNGRPGVSEATRARVVRVANEMGWAPSSAARSLSGARTDTFGLVLARDPRTLGVEPFYMRFIAGLESELAARGCGLLLQVVPDTAAEIETYRQWRAARRVDGTFVVDLRVDDPRLAVLDVPGALPAIIVGDPSLAGSLTSVWTDDAAAMRECLRYLAALGHRRIARVSGIAELGHTAIRSEAFVEESGLLGLDGLIVETDCLPEQGAVATRSLLTRPEPPTAIVYDNDITALAGLGVASELGVRVPDEVSLLAWDDSPLCTATWPQLAALTHDVVASGAHVARRMFEEIAGAPRGAFRDSTPQLTVRGSVARAPLGA